MNKLYDTIKLLKLYQVGKFSQFRTTKNGYEVRMWRYEFFDRNKSIVSCECLDTLIKICFNQLKKEEQRKLRIFEKIKKTA